MRLQKLLFGLKFLVFNVSNPVEVLIKYTLGRDFTIKLEDGKDFPGKRGRGSIHLLMTARRRGYSLEPYKEGLYIAEKNGVQIVGDHIEAISGAYEEDYLSFDIEGKNVLDIGGHLGTTATLFKKIGECNKVYVYEPVEPKREIIEDLAQRNNVEQDIHIRSYGASSSSGEENVSSKHPPESGSFGFDSGNHTIKIQTKAWDEILQEGIENEVYLVKVDCEGCEKHLVAVDEDTITEFDAWAIETHSKKIRKNLERKFEKCGFDVEVSKKSTHRPSGKETSILHAEKVN